MTARLIILDIETYRTRDAEAIERIREEAYNKECAKSASKDAKLEWNTEAARQERFREALDKTAVDTFLAEILCIVVAIDEGPPIKLFVASDRGHGTAEAELLTKFAEIVEHHASQDTVWVGHNIEGFDLPVLLNRMRRHRIQLPAVMPFPIGKGWRGRVYDTMQRAPGRMFVSMDSLCEAYDVELRPVMWQGEPMHGGRVGACYDAAEIGILLDYCAEDVLATRDLYNVMTCFDKHGTYPPPSGLADRLDAIERDESLTESAKAISQVAAIKAAGAWPK